jgi:hypothetical protein
MENAFSRLGDVSIDPTPHPVNGSERESFARSSMPKVLDQLLASGRVDVYIVGH